MSEEHPVIDFHTHAFPDALAERAIPQLEKEGDIRALLDGKVSSLLRSMDSAGIELSVLCSIATRPEQFDSILKWSLEVASDRLITFPSIHPRDANPLEKLRRVHDAGLKGIKLHPYYQDCTLDEEPLFPLYEKLQTYGLILVVHTGFDIAFERVRRADPEKVARIVNLFPRLRFVATHLGAWMDWDEVRKHILGKPVYLETSFAVEYLGIEPARDLFLAHPPDRLLFGSDSPWTDQKEALRLVRALRVGSEREEQLLRANARRLLGLP